MLKNTIGNVPGLLLVEKYTTVDKIKQYKSWFEREGKKLLDQRKQANPSTPSDVHSTPVISITCCRSTYIARLVQGQAPAHILNSCFLCKVILVQN
jgi:hypothetical protein